MPAPERDHLHTAILDAVGEVLGEVHARLKAKLSEQDTQAVMTGIEKAVVTGVRVGFVEAAAQVEESGVSLGIKRLSLTFGVTDD